MSGKKCNQSSDSVVQLVDPAYHRLLEQSIEEKSLERFLEAISLIADSTIQDDAALDCWKNLKIEDERSRLPGVLLDWIATLDFSPGIAVAELGVPIASPSKAVDKAAVAKAKEAGKLAFQEFKLTLDRVKHFKTSSELREFQGFYGAVPLMDFLTDPEMHAIADAARLVAEYNRHLFSAEEWETPSRTPVHQAWLREFVEVEVIPFVIQLILEIDDDERTPTWFTEQSSRVWPFLPGLLAREIDLSNPDTFPDGFEVATIPELMLNSPQGLFDVVAELVAVDLPEFEFEDQEEPYLRIFDLMTCLPLESSPAEINSFKQSLPADSIVRDHLARIHGGFGLPRVRCEQLADLLLMYCTSWPPIQDLATNGFSRVGDLDWTPERLGQRLRRVNQAVGDLRREHAGLLPCDMHHAALLGYSLDQMSTHIGLEIDFDLSLLLAGDEDSCGVIGYEAGVASPVLPFVGESGDTRELHLRSKLFRKTVDGAVEDGFGDLADALLGFYLVTQTMAAQHWTSIDWSWVSERLAERVDRPDRGLVRRCVRLSHEFASEGGTAKWLDKRQLSRHLRDDSQGTEPSRIRMVLAEMEDSMLQEARQTLSQRLGQTVIEGLGEKDRKALQEAEYAYQHAIRRQDERDQQPDFGPVVISWFKVVEKWLCSTYECISDHPRFHELVGLHESPSPPTLSRIIRVFHRFRQLPEEMKMHLRKKRCRLGSKPEYSTDWLDELRLLRNRAAHASPLRREDVVRVREVLLNGGLTMLVRALPPEVFDG